jgi:hypothetical protein
LEWNQKALDVMRIREEGRTKIINLIYTGIMDGFLPTIFFVLLR